MNIQHTTATVKTRTVNTNVHTKNKKRVKKNTESVSM